MKTDSPRTARPHLSTAQRASLAVLLQSRLAELEQRMGLRLQGQTQADSARQTLLQDADDARQLAGAHEVEGMQADLDSRAFEADRSAMLRLHSVGYGLCMDCEKPIPFNRLLAEPQALRCLACEKIHEQEETT